MVSRGWALFMPIFLQGLLCTPVVFSEGTIDCKNPSTTLEMQSCLRDEMEAADRELNELYRSIYSDLRRSKKQALATEIAKDQRRWGKSRWKYCDEESSEEGGGTIVPLIFQSCYIQETHERVLELKQRYGPRDEKRPADFPSVETCTITRC